ncbi:MAG: hypothetical protein ACT4QC_02305 [Planctomycetaceae bacterium]
MHFDRGNRFYSLLLEQEFPFDQTSPTSRREARAKMEAEEATSIEALQARASLPPDRGGIGRKLTDREILDYQNGKSFLPEMRGKHLIACDEAVARGCGYNVYAARLQTLDGGRIAITPEERAALESRAEKFEADQAAKQPAGPSSPTNPYAAMIRDELATPVLLPGDKARRDARLERWRTLHDQHEQEQAAKTAAEERENHPLLKNARANATAVTRGLMLQKNTPERFIELAKERQAFLETATGTPEEINTEFWRRSRQAEADLWAHFDQIDATFRERQKDLAAARREATNPNGGPENMADPSQHGG